MPNIPESLNSIQTRHLFTLRLDVKPVVIVGPTPNGFRRSGTIPGGSFEGERLSGIVVDGGNDWQLVRPDLSVVLDVRLNLKTAGGDMIGMYYTGLRTGDTNVLKRIDAGEAVDPAEYYFRTAPRFETPSVEYQWLNHIIAIGKGYRGPAGVVYNIFEVL